MIREDIISRFDELKFRQQAELIAKRLFVKAAREDAAVRKTVALKKKAAAVQAKVAEVKQMKQRASGESKTCSLRPKDRKIIRPDGKHINSQTLKPTRTKLTQPEPTHFQPETSITPCVDVKARDIKALRAAKARAAIARRDLIIAVEETAMVDISAEGSAVIEHVSTVNRAKVDRRQKVLAAVEALKMAEQIKVNEVVTEMKSVQASILQAVEELKSVQALIKRVKSITPKSHDDVEIMEHEVDPIIIPSTLRWPKYASRLLSLLPLKRRFRRMKKRKVLLCADAVPRLGLFKVQLLTMSAQALLRHDIYIYIGALYGML